MKILIPMILYISAISILLPKEQVTHTFKTHNFRIDLPAFWELTKSFEDHKKVPILAASSREDGIHLEIYVLSRTKTTMKKGFVDALQHLHLKAQNYTSLEQEAEFPLYNLEGYWAKTTGFKQKKKIYGYLVYASDGVNFFVIHTYTNANLFQKNFQAMKKIYNGFTLNRNFKNECCIECTNISHDQAKSTLGCAEYTETDECFQYFQNIPSTISQCK